MTLIQTTEKKHKHGAFNLSVDFYRIKKWGQEVHVTKIESQREQKICRSNLVRMSKTRTTDKRDIVKDIMTKTESFKDTKKQPEQDVNNHQISFIHDANVTMLASVV